MPKHPEVYLDFVTANGRTAVVTCVDRPEVITARIAHFTTDFYTWTFVGQREVIVDNRKQTQIIK